MNADGEWTTITEAEDLIASQQQRIAELEAALKNAIYVIDCTYQCPICKGVDRKHGLSCNVPKWQVLAAAGKEPHWTEKCPLCGSTDPNRFFGECSNYTAKNQPAHIFHWPSTDERRKGWVATGKERK